MSKIHIEPLMGRMLEHKMCREKEHLQESHYHALLVYPAHPLRDYEQVFTILERFSRLSDGIIFCGRVWHLARPWRALRGWSIFNFS